MPSLRLHPLLIAGAACLMLAACGGDDDPPQAAAPTQTESAAPAETESAAPTETAPAPTPTTTAPAGDAPAGDAPAGDEDTADAPSRAAGDQPQEGQSTAPTDTPGTTQQQQNPTGNLQERLRGYAAGGKSASKRDAADIRESMTTFQAALASRNRSRICEATVGLPESSDGKAQSISCESLAKASPAKPQSAEDRRMIASAKLTVKGDKAIAEMGQGFPLPFQKVDGRWRLDYGEMMRISGGSR